MPSSTFLSELTEGLTRFCSIREIKSVGYAGALRQFTLRQTVHLPHGLKMAAHIHAHSVYYNRQNWVWWQPKLSLVSIFFIIDRCLRLSSLKDPLP